MSGGSAARSLDDHARQLREQGFTCLPGLLPSETTAEFAAALRAQWERLGQPGLYSREDIWLEPGVHVSPVGMTCAGILGRVPGTAAVLLRPELLGLFEAILGPGFELELGAGIVSDHTRPFFFWHHHVGGIDGEDFRGRPYSDAVRAERVVCTLYCSPVDDEHGTMLVWPRAITDSVAPPFTPSSEPWPGATAVQAPVGTVIVFDQGTWHAVTPMTRTGQRYFVGFFVRRAGLPPTVRRDETIAAALARDPALASAYGQPGASA
ncbi:MAG: hypothetical protein R6X02_08510 [Enhygromyxa sp.]